MVHSQPLTRIGFRISYSALGAVILLTAVLAASGCGNQTEPTPRAEGVSQAPAAETEPTKTVSNQVDAAATSPALATTPASNSADDTGPTAESFAKIIPTTAHQARQVIDFLSLERFEPKAHWDEKELIFQNSRDFLRLFYESQLPMSELVPRYTQMLEGLGWQEFSDSEATKYSDDRLSIQWFSKDSYYLSLMFQKLEEGASVSFDLTGNIDARQIPLPTVGEEVISSVQMTLNKTELNLEELATFYDRVLGEHGWDRHFESADEADDPELNRIHYRRNAMRIRVRLTDDTLYVIPSLLLHDFPALSDATNLLIEQTACTYTTSASVGEIVEFYEKRMGTFGWEHRPEMQEVSPKFGQMFFAREDGQGLLINVRPSKETMRVEMGIIEPDKLAELALHRSLLKKVRSSYLVTGEANMLTLNSFYNSIDYRVPLTAKELADYYTQALTSRGWDFVFEPDIEENEASLWLQRENKDGEREDIRVKITPFGQESAVEVGGKLRPLIEAE